MTEEFLELVHLNEAVEALSSKLEGRLPLKENIDVDDSLGRVAALDITAPADMPGFEACPVDRRREHSYVMRQQVEMSNRRAIREDRKLYDSDLR